MPLNNHVHIENEYGYLYIPNPPHYEQQNYDVRLIANEKMRQGFAIRFFDDRLSWFIPKGISTV